LDDKYVLFDYTSTMHDQKGTAHGIFAWDEKMDLYRFWWFENSGNFSTANCKFVDDGKLFMHWQDSLLLQTFTRVDSDKMILRMESPNAEGAYDLIMEVIFTRTS
jgi:hypothetical protein